MTAPLDAPWAFTAAEVLHELGSDPTTGVSEDDAARRLSLHGPNRLPERELPRRIQILFAQLSDPLVVILVVAAAVSGAVLREWIDASVIAAIVVLNSALGYSQHAKAEDALAALRQLTAPEATVTRDGRTREVPAADLVPGDLITVAAGDRVPADARLYDARHLVCDEASLTGESLPVEKDTAPASREAPVAEQHSMVFAGTIAVSGRGAAAVTATGLDTRIGAIARLVAVQKDPPTPLQTRLADLGRRISFLAAGVGAAVIALGALRRFPADEIFLTAVALAVAAIPEGLPAAVTVTLAAGVRRLAERNALVRSLPAVETLGSAEVICTDKTGTLTRNRLRVDVVVFGPGEDPVVPGAITGPRAAGFARVASLCNDARLGDSGWIGDPIDVSLADVAVEIGADPMALRRSHPRLDEAAFDSSRKRMTTLHPLDGGYLVTVKGAPEVVLGLASAVAGERGPVPLDEAGRNALAAAVDDMAARGLRTLALAERVMPDAPAALEDAESGLVLMALVGMLDEPRPEAAEAVRAAREAGIRIVMVTGDHASAAATIAARLGVAPEPVNVLSGRTLHDMPPEQLAEDIDNHRVVARVDPVDKVKLVEAWKTSGRVVAMTGDGVNDAPALRAADIGVAMGSGSDVGKESSDLILADDNFATLVAAVEEGRRIFLNLQKLVWFLLAANAAEVLVVTFGLAFFGNLGSPLLPTHILWINLVTDGLPVLALAADPAPPDVMRRPPTGSRVLLDTPQQVRLLGRGAILAAATLSAFAYAHLLAGAPWPRVRTVGFTALVTVQLAYALTMRRTDGHRASLLGNRLLTASVSVSLLLQVAVVHTPLGRKLFVTVQMTGLDWLAVAAVTVAVLAWFGLRREVTDSSVTCAGDRRSLGDQREVAP